MLPGRHYMGSLPCRLYLLAPLTGNNEGSKGQAYTNSVPGQHPLNLDGQHALAFYIKCVAPEGQAGV